MRRLRIRGPEPNFFLGEQLTLNQRVQGSSPCAPTKLSSFSWMLLRDSALDYPSGLQSVPNVYPGDQDGQWRTKSDSNPGDG